MGRRSVEFEGPRWLVLLLQGVRRADLDPKDAPTLYEQVLQRPPVAIETPPPTTAAVDRFFDALPVDTLRDAGLRLDRRTWGLRPDWQSDRAAVDGVLRPRRRRAEADTHGLPDVLTLWLRDAGRAAIRAGIGSPAHRQAIRDLDAQVAHLLQRTLKDGHAPRVAALTLAPLAPVDRWFDPGRVLARELPRRLAPRVAVEAHLTHARIRCASMRDLADVATMFDRPAFGHHGSLCDPAELDALGFPRRHDELVFVPHDRVALAHERVCAAPTFAPRAGTPAQATLPWRARDRADSSLSIERVAKELGARVATQLRVVEPVESTDVSEAVAEFPDLLRVLDPSVAQVLGSLL